MSNDLRAPAQEARDRLIEIVLAYVVAHPAVTNADVAQALGLESGFEGAHRNYFTHDALLSKLVEAGRLKREKEKARVRYSAAS